MQLVLQVDEGVVPGLVEGDSPQDGPDDVRSDLEHAGLEDQLLRLFGRAETVARHGEFPLEHQQGSDQALQAQQVVSRYGRIIFVGFSSILLKPVGSDFNLINFLFLAFIIHFFDNFVQLEAKLETKFVELLLCINFTKRIEEQSLLNTNGWHGSVMFLCKTIKI